MKPSRFVCAILCIGLFLGIRESASSDASGLYLLEEVIDPQTLVLLSPTGETQTVQLAGIAVDRPEYKQKATEFLSSLLRDHEQLYLDFERPRPTSLQFPLAYVWVVHRRTPRWLAVHRISMNFTRDGLNEYWEIDRDDGLQFRSLNAELVKAGYVNVSPNPPDSRHLNQLKQLALEAKKRRQAEIQAKRRSGIPRNLDECYLALKLKLRQPEIIQFMNTPEKELSRYHHGLGVWLRNRWGLWQDSELRQFFTKKGVEHPDDMSRIILISFHRHLNKKDVALDELISYTAKEEVDLNDGH